MESSAENELHVRDAASTDWEALVAIKPETAAHRDRLRDAAAACLRYLVLERKHQVIGFACLVFARPSHWSDAQDPSRLPQVVDFQILPLFRSRGYGSFFLREMERLAAERGCSSLYLAVNPLDNPRAHVFYLRQGYQPLQAQPYRNQWEHVDSEGQRHHGEEWIVDMIKSLPAPVQE